MCVWGGRQGKVATLQRKITDGRSCLSHSRGLITVWKVQENLNNLKRKKKKSAHMHHLKFKSFPPCFLFFFLKLANEFDDTHRFPETLGDTFVFQSKF